MTTHCDSKNGITPHTPFSTVPTDGVSSPLEFSRWARHIHRH